MKKFFLIIVLVSIQLFTFAEAPFVDSRACLDLKLDHITELQRGAYNKLASGKHRFIFSSLFENPDNLSNHSLYSTTRSENQFSFFWKRDKTYISFAEIKFSPASNGKSQEIIGIESEIKEVGNSRPLIIIIIIIKRQSRNGFSFEVKAQDSSGNNVNWKDFQGYVNECISIVSNHSFWDCKNSRCPTMVCLCMPREQVIKRVEERNCLVVCPVCGSFCWLGSEHKMHAHDFHFWVDFSHK